MQETDVISAFIKVAPLLNGLIQDDITVGIYDTEKLIINIPAKTFALNVTPGDPLVEGDVITNAIKTNKSLSVDLYRKNYSASHLLQELSRFMIVLGK